VLKLENTVFTRYPYLKLSLKANKITEKYYKNKIYLRGVIEFSNYCIQDCLYCGIRKSNTKIYRYRMSLEQIFKCIKNGYKMGLRTFVLQSGEDPFYTSKMITSLIEKVKNKIDNKIAITLSIGIRPKNEYIDFKKAGADRFLMRFETSDEKMHKYLRNGISLKNRLIALENLKNAGYEVGSGFMIGLPEETESIFNGNINLCKDLELHMIGIGPFIPHPDTPLKKYITSFNKEKALISTIKAVSLLRINLPYSNIPATTAMGTIHPMGREMALLSGANVLMPNITINEFKKHYLLYPDKICINESGTECIECQNIRLKNIGKVISFERGDSLLKTIKG